MLHVAAAMDQTVPAPALEADLVERHLAVIGCSSAFCAQLHQAAMDSVHL